jgi:predicted negative regulator of RcsB-dependent stress response
MSKYTRKQRVTQSDEFLSFWQKAFVKAEPYARAIMITIGSTLAVVFVAWGVTGHYERKAQASTEIWGRAVRVYDSDLLEAEGASPKAADTDGTTPRYKTESERAEAALKELQPLEKSALGKNAQLFRAGVLYDLGRYEEADALFQSFLKGGNQIESLHAVAQEGIGLCQEARGQLDAALASYKKLEPSRGDYFRDRALYDQARVVLKKGDKMGARKLYAELLAKTPTSPLREDAQNRLTVLEEK